MMSLLNIKHYLSIIGLLFHSIIIKLPSSLVDEVVGSLDIGIRVDVGLSVQTTNIITHFTDKL